jgi:hypothetical protein
MPRTTPESTFALAQQAMERGDWEAFFQCLDRSDLLPLAKMGIAGIPNGGDQALAALCVEAGIPATALENVKTIADEILASAQAMMRAPAADSYHRHRDLVKSLDKAMETCLKSVADLALFTAKAERLKRAKMGGGSVSSSLFVGETLVDVTVEGKKAKGIRQRKGGSTEPIAFVQNKGLWSIKFMPKRRSGPR